MIQSSLLVAGCSSLGKYSVKHVIASASEAISIRDYHVVLKAFRTPRNDKKERNSLNLLFFTIR